MALVARGCCRVHEGTLWSLWLWQYGLSSFQEKDTKVDRFLAKNQNTQKKLLSFLKMVVSTCQKVQISDFQSQFSMSKMIWIFLDFFFFIEQYHFRITFLLLTFFENWDVENALFQKWCPILNKSKPCLFKKYFNFLWVCLFLNFKKTI